MILFTVVFSSALLWARVHSYTGTCNQSSIQNGQRSVGLKKLTHLSAQQTIFDSFATTTPNNNKNFLFSPYSLHGAMSLLYAASGAETRQKLNEFFFNQSHSTADHSGDLAASGCVPNSTKITLDISNALYADQKVKLKADAVSSIQSLFGAKIESLRLVGSEPKINGEVSQATRGMITDLLGEGTFDDLSVLALINAVYLKAPWFYKFDPTKTREDEFHSTETQTSQVQMMRNKVQTGFHESAEGTLVELPYTDPAFVVRMFLPPQTKAYTFEPHTLVDLANGLSARKLTNHTVNVHLPRFDLKSKLLDLTQLLTAANLGSLFESVDLSKLIDTTLPLYVSKALQKVAVKMSEEGTEAAAATAMIAQARSFSASDESSFVANRPFYFAIGHKPSSVVLFTGYLQEPM